MASENNGNNKPRPVVGLALGGGMARGTSHIGVLRVLEKHGIPIDLIAGTSVGSLIGGAYASGLSPDQIQELTKTIRWSDLGRVTVSKLGFYSNARTEEYIRTRFPVLEFEKLRLPLGAVATDIQTGRMVVFTEGNLPLAIRASCAMPVYYTPVEVNGRLMVDGGVVGHLPASVARMMGADIVIAVDVNSQHQPISPPTNMFTVMAQSLSVMGRHTVSYLYQDADIVVIPKIGHIRPDDLRRAPEMIAAGEAATEAVINKIRRKLTRQRPGLLRRLFAREQGDVRRISSLK
ncbi:MAG: patatin-like phospholipase family protein [Acidobacteria bacterium]|nr:patatin-like phospholipase family protein [Acidobacteriota bacterium]MCW5970502.1 patatin-like phospholipase family protein [Blastocatellales bacterium]